MNELIFLNAYNNCIETKSDPVELQNLACAEIACYDHDNLKTGKINNFDLDECLNEIHTIWNSQTNVPSLKQTITELETNLEHLKSSNLNNIAELERAVINILNRVATKEGCERAVNSFNKQSSPLQLSSDYCDTNIFST